MDALTAAKVIGITSSGYTWALSDTAIAGVLDAPEDVLCRQWRYQYLRGFYAAIISTPLNILSWTLLAYHAPTSFICQLYGLAAVTTGSGTVLAWTALRGINGALSIRSFKVAGPGDKPNHVSLSYSRNEAWAKGLEEKYSTKELVYQWIKLNLLRAAILGAGTAIGVLGLAWGK